MRRIATIAILATSVFVAGMAWAVYCIANAPPEYRSHMVKPAPNLTSLPAPMPVVTPYVAPADAPASSAVRPSEFTPKPFAPGATSLRQPQQAGQPDQPAPYTYWQCPLPDGALVGYQGRLYRVHGGAISPESEQRPWEPSPGGAR